MESNDNFDFSVMQPQRPKKRDVTDIFDMDILRELHKIFQENPEEENSLNEEQFREVMAKYCTQQEINEMYPKIDINDDGNVEWHEFTSFLIAAEGNSKIALHTNSYRLVPHIEQPNNSAIMHRDFIDHICFTMKPYPMIITGGRDGLVLVTRPSDMKLIRKLPHESKNTVYVKQLQDEMNTTQKAMVGLIGERNAANGTMGRPGASNSMVISSLCIMTGGTHVCVGSSDNSVTAYDLIGMQVRLWLGKERQRSCLLVLEAIQCLCMLFEINRKYVGASLVWLTCQLPSTRLHSLPNQRITVTKNVLKIRPLLSVRTLIWLWGTLRVMFIFINSIIPLAWPQMRVLGSGIKLCFKKLSRYVYMLILYH